MKTEQLGIVTSVKAVVDIDKNYIADVNGNLCNATAVPLGVVNADTKADEQMPVAVSGIALVTAASAITKGDLVTSDANGKAESTVTNDKLVLGKALDEATASGDLIRVLLR